jgi:hypothetical protein
MHARIKCAVTPGLEASVANRKNDGGIKIPICHGDFTDMRMTSDRGGIVTSVAIALSTGLLIDRPLPMLIRQG